MKNNAYPPPPNDNGKGEQRAEKRERGEKAGLEREEKSPQSVIGPDLLLFGLLSPSGIREAVDRHYPSSKTEQVKMHCYPNRNVLIKT